jgi:uncharacterized cupin superfamily protein
MLSVVRAQARLVERDGGLVPEGDGWFVVSARDARWHHSERFGSSVSFEGRTPFPELGINLNVLRPGEPLGLYHGENAQEDFLVLAGECVLVIEGEERSLRAWDFVHCPAWTEHGLVGAGSGGCVLLAVGARCVDPDVEIRYPADEAASRYGAAVPRTTDSPDEAYAAYPRPAPGPYRDGDLP